MPAAPDSQCLGWATSTGRQCGRNVGRSRVETHCLTCEIHQEFDEKLRTDYDLSAHGADTLEAWYRRNFPRLFDEKQSNMSRQGRNDGALSPKIFGNNSSLKNTEISLQQIAGVASLLTAIFVAFTALANQFRFGIPEIPYFRFATTEDHLRMSFEYVPVIIFVCFFLAAMEFVIPHLRVWHFSNIKHKTSEELRKILHERFYPIRRRIRDRKNRLNRMPAMDGLSRTRALDRIDVLRGKEDKVKYGIRQLLITRRDAAKKARYWNRIRSSTNFLNVFKYFISPKESLLMMTLVGICVFAAAFKAKISVDHFYVYADDLDSSTPFSKMIRLGEVTILTRDEPDESKSGAENKVQSTIGNISQSGTDNEPQDQASSKDKPKSEQKYIIPTGSIRFASTRPLSPKDAPPISPVRTPLNFYIDAYGRPTPPEATANVMSFLFDSRGDQSEESSSNVISSLNTFIYVDGEQANFESPFVLLPMFPDVVKGSQYIETAAFTFGGLNDDGTKKENPSVGVDTPAEAYAFGVMSMNNIPYESPLTKKRDDVPEVKYLDVIKSALEACGEAEPLRISVIGYASDEKFRGLSDSNFLNYMLSEGRRTAVLDKLGFFPANMRNNRLLSANERLELVGGFDPQLPPYVESNKPIDEEDLKRLERTIDDSRVSRRGALSGAHFSSFEEMQMHRSGRRPTNQKFSENALAGLQRAFQKSVIIEVNPEQLSKCPG
jgi:hypothetical protein